MIETLTIVNMDVFESWVYQKWLLVGASMINYRFLGDRLLSDKPHCVFFLLNPGLTMITANHKRLPFKTLNQSSRAITTIGVAHVL